MGLKGTCVLFPQEAHVAGNISLLDDLALKVLPPDEALLSFLAARQPWHRVGSLAKPFSA